MNNKETIDTWRSLDGKSHWKANSSDLGKEGFIAGKVVTITTTFEQDGKIIRQSSIRQIPDYYSKCVDILNKLNEAFNGRK